MIAPAVIFPYALILFLVVLLVTATAYVRRAGRLSNAEDVHVLLRRLVAVDRDKLAQVTADLTATDSHSELEPYQLWELTGGMQGIETLAANCDVLIDLACYVQRWYPEALPVAEQLRLNAREIQWHLERLKGAEGRGNLEVAFPDYAQRAVAIYYGMTQHVLALFEISQVPGLAQLRAAL